MLNGPNKMFYDTKTPSQWTTTNFIQNNFGFSFSNNNKSQETLGHNENYLSEKEKKE